MTVAETAVLMGILKEAYPRFYADKTKDELINTTKLWAEFLGDVDAETATLALKRLISTKTFPPVIAELRDAIAEIKQPELSDAGAAWGEVQQAIRKFGYYRKEELLASLNEPTRIAVERFGLRDLCFTENSVVADRAHFMRIYEAVEKRTKEQNQIPEAIRSDIAALADKMSMSGGDRPMLAVVQGGVRDESVRTAFTDIEAHERNWDEIEKLGFERLKEYVEEG